MEPDFTDYEKVLIAAISRRMSWWERNGNAVLVLCAAVAIYLIGLSVESRALEILAAVLPAARITKKMTGDSGTRAIASIIKKYQVALEEVSAQPGSHPETKTPNKPVHPTTDTL
jgi:hypothetical protein